MFKNSTYIQGARTARRSSARQWLCWPLALLLASAAGHAQEFPVRPVRVIVASGAFSQSVWENVS